MIAPDDDDRRLRIVATRARRSIVAATFVPLALVWLAGAAFFAVQVAGVLRGGNLAAAIILGVPGVAVAWGLGAMATYVCNAATWAIEVSPQHARLRSLAGEIVVPLAAIGRVRFASGGRGWRYGVLYAGETVAVVTNLMFADKAFAQLEHEVRDFLARHANARDETGDGPDQAFLRGDRRIARRVQGPMAPAGLAGAAVFLAATALLAWI